MTATFELKPYQRVVAATGLSNLADGIRFVALPLLALEVTKSPFFMTAVAAANMAPWLIFGLWAGGLTDRSDRKVLAQRTALLRVSLLSLLAVLILIDVVPVPLLLIAAFVLGTSEVLADNVNGALIPSLVPDAELERANSRMVGAEILGNELVGPAAGGLLFAAAISLPFFTNAGLLAVALLLLSGLPLIQTTQPCEVESEPTELRTLDGIASVLSSPLLRTITWSSALLAAVDGAWFALLAYLVVEEMGLSFATFGLLLAVGAVGGLAGAAVTDFAPDLRLSFVAGATFTSMAGPLIVLSLYPNVVVVAVALVVTSGAFSMWNVFMVSARQRASTSQTLGRVGAAYRTVVVAAAIVGTLLGGLLTELFSIRIALSASAIVLAVSTPAVVKSFRAHSAGERNCSDHVELGGDH